MINIVIKSVDDLVPYARNGRKHSDDQINQIGRSIKEFGFNSPVIVDGNNGIIAGHGRVIAAKNIGLQVVPTIELTHLSEQQKSAYIIADNKIAQNSEWDNEIVSIEMNDLVASGFDISLTGFSISELDSMLSGRSEGDHDGQVVSDNYSGNYVSRVHSGDIFALGNHRLMCGDSGSIESVNMLLDGAVPGLLVYDPPYENLDAWGYYYPCNKAIVFTDFKYIKRAMSICSLYDVNYQFIWDNCTSWYTPNRPLARHKSAIFCSNDKHWDFDSAIYQDSKSRKSKTVTNTRGELDYVPLSNGFVHLQTVYQEPNSKQDSGHAHSKPLKWINSLMRGAAENIILDLFAGSGATIMAAPIGSTVYAMEISSENCDRILARWEQSTGLSAIKL